MSSRSLNKVTLIGNLTRDPELRYTPAGTAVCTFGLATNRTWTTQSGETKEETEFHRVVAWNKLGELCSQLLVKGRKVYVEGRLATHSWTAQDGSARSTTEVVIEDMILLDSKRPVSSEGEGVALGGSAPSKTEAPSSHSEADFGSVAKTEEVKKPVKKVSAKEEETPVAEAKNEDITPDDIPF